jgi:F0F1-type ATP synthase epsilon subunit
MPNLVLDIALKSCDQVIYSGQAVKVCLVGEKGITQIEPGYSTFFQTLRTGIAHVWTVEGPCLAFFLFGGVGRVSQNQVTIMTPRAVQLSQEKEASLQVFLESLQGKNLEQGLEPGVLAQESLFQAWL